MDQFAEGTKKVNAPKKKIKLNFKKKKTLVRKEVGTKFKKKKTFPDPIRGDIFYVDFYFL